MSASKTNKAIDLEASDSKIMPRRFYQTRTLTRMFGAEVLGIDLSNSMDLLTNPLFIQQIKEDLVQHRFLLFRNQDLSGDKQVFISNQLGTVTSTFYQHPRSPHPDIFRVSNDDQEGCTNVGRSGWHIDGTFMEHPFCYQTMHFPSVAEGGDTYFIPLKEMYEGASPALQNKWNRLWMVTGRRSAPIHPLVYQHPFRHDTTMVFHCGAPFVQGWMEEPENTASNETNGEYQVKNHPKVLLKDGFYHQDAASIQSEITKEIESNMETGLGLKMVWQKGDFAIMDNLGLAHYACDGTQRDRGKVGLRILHRTTVTGGPETVPMKADGRRSFFE